MTWWGGVRQRCFRDSLAAALQVMRVLMPLICMLNCVLAGCGCLAVACRAHPSSLAPPILAALQHPTTDVLQLAQGEGPLISHLLSALSHAMIMLHHGLQLQEATSVEAVLHSGCVNPRDGSAAVLWSCHNRCHCVCLKTGYNSHNYDKLEPSLCL